MNAAWSWIFFAANSPLLGLINIAPQLALIFATIVVFYRLDRLAAYYLVPLPFELGSQRCSTSRSGFSIAELRSHG
jgi:tryptophan-rich sensory protein